jgi:hypothetical protein
MFQRVISILLIPLFLLTTGGIAFNIHFCKMSGSSDVSFLINKSSCCGKKGMESGCCKNKVQVIKIKDDYSASTSLEVKKNDSSVLLLISFFVAEIMLGEGLDVLNYHSPPPESSVSLSILFRSILV